MKVLTIIIPSYNTELFIDDNIKTFINKELFKDVEILLINDGSKDQTAKKITHYSKKYPEYIRAINKENGGHGSAINVGIEKANGKYIKVIDADDWVDTGNLIKLKDALKDCDADLVINPYIKIDQNSKKELTCGQINKEDIINFQIPFDDIKKMDYRLALHSITIKTAIFRKNKLRMTEKCFYEDFEYTLYPIPFIETVKYLDYSVYYYLVGQKTQSVSASNGLKNMPMYIRVIEDSLKYYKSCKEILNKNTANYMENCLLTFIRSMYNVFLRNKSSKAVYSTMLEYDKKLSNISTEFYEKVGNNNTYIRILRKRNYTSYKLISYIFRKYKSKEIS